MAKVDLADIANLAGKGTVQIQSSEKALPFKTTEKKTSRRMVNLKPSEYEDFVGMIGRQSFSDAVRTLILAEIQNGKK